jgi:ATP-dependent DNA helicase RecG
MTRRRTLQRSVQYLKGVGPRRAERFARLGIRTARDLLYHVPHRYEDATTVAEIASLRPGDEASVIGRVVSQGVLATRKGLRIFHAVLRDGSGVIECAWPGQPWLDNKLRRGDLLLVSGSVHFFHGRQLRPREFIVLDSSRDDALETGRVFSIYRATEGLSQRQIRAILQENLGELLAEVEHEELFSAQWRSALGLVHLREALETMHRPRSLDEIEGARRRIAYEELFFLQLLHARARHEVRGRTAGISFSAPAELSGRFLEGLPFSLTSAQLLAWEEIRADMESGDRMYRLLQGDVGSGKTVIAAAGMLKAVENGRQAAIMAPTELLAEQHHRTLSELMSALDVEPRLLTGSVGGRKREDIVEAIRAGESSVVVGTHALIQEGIEFGLPGLMIIDEQHRFGVEQRRSLRDLGGSADTLVMSATPIPRSLALTLYGDLDLSVIDEMPPERRPVITGVRGPEDRDAAFEFAREQLAAGRQAYVVYPLVEESEVIQARAAAAEFEELKDRFPEFALGLLHGRLGTTEKDETMRRFLRGEVNLLVATTVIEVGIDVPNATVMLIEHAERFGLAQLHQLRGRVGRGADQSYCVAFYSGSEPPERLLAFARTSDGFELAREDLRLRGEGNLFGLEQHGLPALRFADLEKDMDLLQHARLKAQRVVAGDPDLASQPNRAFARELAERYADREALYGVG